MEDHKTPGAFARLRAETEAKEDRVRELRGAVVNNLATLRGLDPSGGVGRLVVDKFNADHPDWEVADIDGLFDGFIGGYGVGATGAEDAE